MPAVFLRSHSTHGRTKSNGSAIALLAAIAFLLDVGYRTDAARADCQDRPDTNPALRGYHDGPLTAADFRAQPPIPLPEKNGLQLSAITYTTLNYSTLYRWQQVRTDAFEARLTHFEIVAQVDRQKSWTTRPTDERLLDHEQGHFDMTEMWGRRIQTTMNSLIANGTVVGRGHDSKSAIADLNRQTNDRVKELMRQETKAQNEYDLATQHGMNHRVQAEQRRSQTASLREKPAKASLNSLSN